MTIARRQHTRRGFTLMELMVGLAISTIILGAAAGIFVSTMQSWERGSNTHRMMQVAQTTGDLVEKHLRSAVAPASGTNVIFWGFDLTDGETPGHYLTFLSSAPGRFPRAAELTDTSEIEFYFDPLDGEGMSMRIDSVPDDYPDEGGYRGSLSPLITGFQVMYHDGFEWLEEWFEDGLPQAVEFRITITDPEDIDAETGTPRVFQVSRLVSLPTAPRQDPGALETGTTFQSGTQGAMPQ